MTFSKWLRLSISTLMVSVLTSYALALFMRGTNIFTFFGFGESQTGGAYLLVLGLLFGAISLALFFSYQFIQYLALQMLGKWLWNAIQILLIVLAGVDLAYLRFIAFPDQTVSFWPFLDWAIIIWIGAFIGAWIKVKMTNAQAWIPSMFYLVIATVIGGYYSFKTYDNAIIWFVVLPVFMSNFWQLLILPYFLKGSIKNEKSAPNGAV